MKLYGESDTIQRRYAIDTIFQLKRNNQQLALDDYALSDETVGFVKNRNLHWANRDLHQLISSFNYSLVQVYDKSLNLIYSSSDANISDLDSFRLEPGLIDSLASGQKLFYFSKHKQVVLANAVASIHKSDDLQRNTPIQGYLLISQAWDFKFLADMAKSLNYDIRISSNEPTAEDNTEQYNTKIIRPITDWNARPVAWLIFYSSNPYLIELRNLGNIILFGTMGFIMVFLVLQFVLIQQWITAPLSLISQSLKKNDPTLIKPLGNKGNEFSDVSLLIERFFAQKQDLIQEIDERVRTENKLRQIEEQTRKILITSPESIIVTDLEGVILSANDETLRLLELDSESQITECGMKIVDLVPPSERRLLEKMFMELFKGVYVKNQEFTFDNGKQHRFPSLISASVILDENRQPVKLIFITRDLSDLKSLELQLRQSQKMESVGTLAGGIAHDFNNIITIIAGYIALAAGKVESHIEVQDDLDEALKACLRAKSLIGKILTFSRQSELDVEEVVLADIIEDSIPMIRATIPSKIHIETDLESYRYTMADTTELQQVLINLATNAYHAMRPDGGTLSIFLKEIAGFELIGIDSNVELETTYLHLMVGDTGCGIAPEIINRIFDPYFSTKGTGEGTGLGLSIVHGIVTGYRGFINVRSTPSVGTIFNIYLPVIEAPKAKKNEPKQKAFPFKPARILMVDDEPALAEIFCQALLKAGYQVRAFCDSSEALLAFEDDPDFFDLVIADITMPHMDGIKLASSIKAHRDIPIILYTGFCDHSIQQRADAAGIKYVLNKPILPNELSKVVREAVYTYSKHKSK